MGIRGNGQLNNPYWSTWVRETWANANTYRLVKRYMKRPPEQLYHTEADRYELENLVGRSDQSERLERMREELDLWMKTQADPGAPVDTDKAIQAARKGKHLYGASAGGE